MALTRFCLVASLCLAGAGTVFAETPRIATVDAAELFAKYYRTSAEKAKLASEQKKIGRDPRTAVIARIREELAELDDQARDSANSEGVRQEFFRKSQMKRHELRSLERDTLQYRQSRQKELNRKLVRISKILLSEVQSTVQHVAAAEGYDLVLDVSGDTSSQVPTLIYIRDSTDITPRVLKELNRHKPAPLPAGVTAVPPTRRPPSPAPDPAPPAPPADDRSTPATDR